MIINVLDLLRVITTLATHHCPKTKASLWYVKQEKNYTFCQNGCWDFDLKREWMGFGTWRVPFTSFWSVLLLIRWGRGRRSNGRAVCASERGCPVVKQRYCSVKQVWVRKLEISLPGLLGDSKKDRKLLVCYKTIEEIKNGWRGRKALQYMLLLLLK